MQIRRKPYIRKTGPAWWAGRGVYIRYMIREMTALFALWLAAELLICALAAATGENAADWIASFIRHPGVIAMNIISLVAVTYHTVTWFCILPEGVRVFRTHRPDDTRLVPRRWISAACYGVTLVASVLIAWALTCTQ